MTKVRKNVVPVRRHGIGKKPLTGSRWPYWVMLAPFLIVFTLFLFIPILSGFALSLTDFNGLQTPRFVGLENYLRMFLKDEIFLVTLKNTLVLALVTGPTGYILSFMVAWLINELGRKLRLLVLVVMYTPSMCANLFFVWQFIFSGDSKGFINSTLISMGLIQEPILWLSDSRYTMAVVIVVTIWMSFSFGFLSFVAGLRGLDRAYYEAAAIDGLKNRWQELFYVTLPQMGPQLMFGAVTSIASAFTVGNNNIQLTGYPSTNNSTDTLVLYMGEYAGQRFELGYAAAMTVVLFAMMLLAWYLLKKLLKALNAG